MANAKFVTIAKYDDYLQASLMKQVLDEAGIDAIVIGEKVAEIFPGASPIELQVNADLYDEAAQIIKAFEESQSESHGDDEEFDDIEPDGNA